jgi:hypothetical protein
VNTPDKPVHEGEGAPGAGGRSLPEPSFSLLVAGIAAQGQVSLGLRPHPSTNETKKDLAGARHAIGLLEMLEMKSKGNLDDDERRLLSAVLRDLRMAYVQGAK